MTTAAQVEVLNINGITVIRPGTDLANLFEAQLEHIAVISTLAESVSPPRLIVDLQHVKVVGSAFLGRMVAANKTIVLSPQGAVSEKALRFEQTPVTGGSQSITFTFSTPVTAVTMPIYDVDTQRRSWSDRIVVTTTPYSSSIVSPSTVNGTGTVADPFKNSQTDNNFPNTSAEGNVTIGWAGPVSSVTFQFNCGSQDGGTNQLIGIGDILFCV